MIAAIGLNALTVRDWVNYIRNPDRTAEYRATLPALQQLQAEGVSLGYADFWRSINYTYYLGKQPIIAPVLCVNHRLQPHEFLSQKAWYTPAMQPNIKRSFVLIDRPGLVIFAACTRDDVIAQFGAPAETRTVEQAGTIVAEILIWDKNVAEALK